MYQYRKSALLAGATAMLASASHTFAPERKDDDPASLGPEVKKAVADLGTIFETFKTKNDDRLKQLEKRGEDAVTKDEVEKLNKAIDETKSAVQKQIDDILAKANRLALSGGGAEADEAKAAKLFGEQIGKKDFSVEDLRDYKSDMEAWLRNPNAKATTLQVGSDPSGGYLVTPDTSGRIIQKVYESSPMRQLAFVTTIGTDSLEGIVDNDEADAAWVGEQETRAQTNTPQIGTWEIPVHELYAYPMVTQKLLEDASMDVEAWLGRKVASKFARKETTGFYTGDGNKKPKGILAYAFSTADDSTRPWGTFQYFVSGAATTFGGAAPADPLLDVIFGLKAAYRNNARFQMARRTMGAVRKLKDGQGNYLVDLRLRDNALVETIFGFPNVDAEDMPNPAANAYGVGFGDWAETYTIVDRLGLTVIRDNITKPGFVKYNFRKRTGGGAVNFESAKFLKFST